MFAITDSSTVVLSFVEDESLALFIQSCFLDSTINIIKKDCISPGIYRLSDSGLSDAGGIFLEIEERITRASILFDGWTFFNEMLKKVKINNMILSDSQVSLFYKEPMMMATALSNSTGNTVVESLKHLEFCVKFQMEMTCKIQELSWQAETRLRQVKTESDLHQFKEDVLFLLDGKGQM